MNKMETGSAEISADTEGKGRQCHDPDFRACPLRAAVTQPPPAQLREPNPPDARQPKTRRRTEVTGEKTREPRKTLLPGNNLKTWEAGDTLTERELRQTTGSGTPNCRAAVGGMGGAWA